MDYASSLVVLSKQILCEYNGLSLSANYCIIVIRLITCNSPLAADWAVGVGIMSRVQSVHFGYSVVVRTMPLRIGYPALHQIRHSVFLLQFYTKTFTFFLSVYDKQDFFQQYNLRFSVLQSLVFKCSCLSVAFTFQINVVDYIPKELNEPQGF